MDPLSHAVTGSLFAQTAAPRRHLVWAAVVGGLAGMAPDLDAFIRSEENPLLYLDYHRHFTHSLFFAPVLALLTAALGWLPLRRWLSFRALYLYSLLGILPHGLLDACTSYGTYLLWPFSDARIAWSNVAIIDPLYTLPLFILTIAAALRRSSRLALIGVAWAILYLLIGVIQRERAQHALTQFAAAQGHEVHRLEVKPSVFNNFLFRGLYATESTYHVQAVRVGWFSAPRIYPGPSTPIPSREDLYAGLPEGSRMAHGVDRFAIFAQHWLYFIGEDPDRIGDLRYSLLPDSIAPLWHIRVDRTRPDNHIDYIITREVTPERRERFKAMLQGRSRTDVSSETTDLPPKEEHAPAKPEGNEE